MEYTRETRIIDLTLGQFEDWLKSKGYQSSDEPKKNEKTYVFGYAGIMDLFGCSESTAYRLKNSVIKDAVHQCGRIIKVDVELAQFLFNQSKSQ